VIYVPLTSQNRASRYEVELPRLQFLKAENVANVQRIGSLAVTRLERKLGEVPDAVLRKIRRAVNCIRSCVSSEAWSFNPASAGSIQSAQPRGGLTSTPNAFGVQVNRRYPFFVYKTLNIEHQIVDK
jgi:mRNA interferase MazF